MAGDELGISGTDKFSAFSLRRRQEMGPTKGFAACVIDVGQEIGCTDFNAERMSLGRKGFCKNMPVFKFAGRRPVLTR